MNRNDTTREVRRVAPATVARRERERELQRERERRPRRRLRRLTKWMLVTGVVITVFFVAGQWVARAPLFRVQHVTIVGLHHETTSAVLNASGLNDHPSMIGLSDATIERHLSSFAWIHSVSVQKHWPNSVVLTVHENVAVAVAYNEHHVLYYVDAAGRALSPAPLQANLPTLEFEHATTATWPFEKAGRGAAYVASQLPAAFSSQVSVITDDSSGSVTLEMTTPVTFIIGPATNLHAKFVAVASVIAHSTLQPGDVVDVTVPSELAVTPPTS